MDWIGRGWWVIQATKTTPYTSPIYPAISEYVYAPKFRAFYLIWSRTSSLILPSPVSSSPAFTGSQEMTTPGYLYSFHFVPGSLTAICREFGYCVCLCLSMERAAEVEEEKNNAIWDEIFWKTIGRAIYSIRFWPPRHALRLPGQCGIL